MAEVRDREAVDEAEAAGARDPGEGVAERGEVRLVQAARVDPAHGARDDHDLGGRTHDDRVQLGARLGVVLLGVVEGGQRADLADAESLDVEEHRGGDERAREAAAAGLVGTRDPADAQAAVEPEEPAPGAALGARPAPGGGGRRDGVRGDDLVGSGNRRRAGAGDGLGGEVPHDADHGNGRTGGSTRALRSWRAGTGRTSRGGRCASAASTSRRLRR